MKKRVISLIGGALFVILVSYFMLPVFIPNVHSTIKTDPFWVTSVNKNSGNLTVFSLTLNRSTLKDARDVFGNRLSLSIFHNIEDDELSLEAYFRETSVGEATNQAFTGRAVIALYNDPEFLRESIAIAEKDKKSTSKRIIYNIPSEKTELFNQSIIESLSFMPLAVQLTEEDIYHRFGQPELTINEEENKHTVHYLYPNKGIDISLDKKNRGLTIIQYISPNQFEQMILTPLRNDH